MINHRTTIDIARRQLLDAGLATAESIVGCTDQEIRDIEERVRLSLPDSYRYFLTAMGRGAGGFYEGTDWTYDHLEELQHDAKDLIEEADTLFLLPRGSFVFAMHQGYSFLFFDTAEDDPPVWLYVENAKAPSKVASSFSSWLAHCVADQIVHESRD